MQRIAAFGLDLACTAAFVIAGRSSHDAESRSLLVVLAPFLIGLAAGWLAVVLTGLRAEGWRAGATVWALSLGVGMTLRAMAFGGGVQVSFVLVAGTFLGITMLGWRLVHYAWVRRRRRWQAEAKA